MRDNPNKNTRKKGTIVIVQDGNLEKALRKFKNKIEDNGLLEELKEREAFIKPTMARKVAKSKARCRWLKQVASNGLGALKRMY